MTKLSKFLTKGENKWPGSESDHCIDQNKIASAFIVNVQKKITRVLFLIWKNFVILTNQYRLQLIY